MKLSVSMDADDVEFIDTYASAHDVRSRSAVSCGLDRSSKAQAEQIGSEAKC